MRASEHCSEGVASRPRLHVCGGNARCTMRVVSTRLMARRRCGGRELGARKAMA